jgi:hypothetical protein
VRRITTDERRARLAIRHRLTPQHRTDNVATIAEDLVGLHSSDPVTVFVSAWARMATPSVEAVERALYKERTVLRMLGMRRTMFVVPRHLAGVVQASCTNALAANEQRRVVHLIEQAGVTDDGARWMKDVGDATLRAIRKRGEAAAQELANDVPPLKTQIAYGEGKTWAGLQGMSTRVLWALSMRGEIVRTRPRGSWTSSQYRWATAVDWLGDDIERIEPHAAEAELVRRWLRAFGPGTLADIKWWTGWTLTKTKRALAAVAAVEVEADDAAAYVLEDDVEPVAAPPPWVALLPALDSTAMGWSSRDWYLGEHRAVLFDRSGNIGPTVWCDGRVVGVWAQRRDGTIAWRLLEHVGRDTVRAVDEHAARLEAPVGTTRFTPRFRTPLERELSTS